MRRALRSVIAILTLLTQGVVVVASTAEGWRGASATAHAEREGTRLHYGHDGATCVECALRSLHALTPSLVPEPPIRVVRVAAVVAGRATPAHSVAAIANGSRAPPTRS